jgi:hypothetical protein
MTNASNTEMFPLVEASKNTSTVAPRVEEGGETGTRSVGI